MSTVRPDAEYAAGFAAQAASSPFLLDLSGGLIHDFAFAMLVGIIVGTYSSIFVASPILLAWQRKKISA